MPPTELEQLRPVPAFRRDRVAHAWVLMRGIGDAGDAIWSVALAWTAVQTTTPALAGLIVAAGSIPRAVALLFGGVLADRLDARRIMLLFNIARTAVLITVAVWCVMTTPTMAVLLGAALLFGLCDAFYDPASGTISRQLVRRADLAAYTGAMQTAGRLGGMFGAATGGVLIAQAGLAGSAAVNAVTFAVLVGFIAIWLRPRFALPRAAREPVLRGITAGFVHLREAPTTRALVIALGTLNVAIAPVLGVGVALRASADGWGAEGVGFFGAATGIGAAIGAAIVIRWRPRREAFAGFLSFSLQGAAIVGVGLGPYWLVVIAGIVIGFGAGFGSVLLGATFAGVTEPSFLGRMGSIIRLGDDSLRPLTTVAFGALATVTALWVPFVSTAGRSRS
ncbi:Enterobactin exporter EntS [Microbacterium lemovicicum]|uniref:Enterobactin exporter EntS n=1 Tax=Microbacterium lemovicicum TaxID=1072463 RepID=A0A3Q9IZJ0_9MICO|nr:MFS transporter [Microbacterium lemovicicum]AZS36674.1 Enterobactin exporter EntS [Microbacterium lemovicicum]